ncbi:6-cysteine protein P36, putative [Plasmodium chabaudi chabaudi]|uniref:6-cysteine protein P36, putative n=1 Tax=Plasmodium chabaudi chabaudi TaxID=31271 RepID=A0A4V0K1F8_PLACU|nr:6-cysteine protein P36, putative [Plasmodium chabaudi chabaudi]VTZ66366.1 6-cysteine protein P36, putative [Plasmodium chabaudi chabaudi]|eukprot:XP_733952.2 6-cysteine protein [Plasmodium chabaudi chabaudi]
MNSQRHIICHINTYFSVARNMFFSIFLYYAFSLLIFLSIYVFKMRKALYSLLFYMCVCLYIYTPVLMASLKDIEVGNYFICNLKDYPPGNCSVDHDYNKAIKLLCPIVHNKNNSDKGYDPSYCFKYDGIKDEFIINNKQNHIHNSLPGVILTNHIENDTYNVSIYPPFVVKEDITIVCICDSEKGNEGITPYLKINIKKAHGLNNNLEGDYIKGCDYGNNRGKFQFLTKPVKYINNPVCEIEAYPGDVVGINCNSYITKMQGARLEPESCFSMVYFSNLTMQFTKTSVNNIMPNAKYYPDLSPHPGNQNSKMFLTSYLLIPNDLQRDILIYCHCSYNGNKGLAMFHIFATKAS